MAKKRKIVCICQIYNELEKGNLKRFFKYILPIVDELVVYDDASTDGSFEYAKKFTKHVIRAVKNDFSDEVNHRKILLKEALSLKPDFILRLDADEVLTSGAKEKIQEICLQCEKDCLDAMEFHRINIWRSSSWQRMDSLYDDGWEAFLWRVTPQLGYRQPVKKGLHQKDLVPPSIKRRARTDKLSVLHYGFADELNLAYKYLIYRSHGQRGYEMLDRLINEESLVTKKIPKIMFPEGLYQNDPKPVPRNFVASLKAAEAYGDRVFRPKYSIACLVYKSVDWLKFVYEQVLKNTDMADKEFYFVANDASEEVLRYLEDNYIPHYVFNNKPEHKSQWYINNVYRAWNYAAKVARGDFIVFINTDMAFTSGWLDCLIACYDGDNCVTSRLIESGKLESAKPAISKNFGRTIEKFREKAFCQYADLLEEDKVTTGGLFMPLLIKKEHFLKVGGYPEGNIVAGSDIFKPRIAKPTDKIISGDVILMEKLKAIGVRHITSHSSMVYHFQCGEMDSRVDKANSDKVSIAIVNDIAGGSMGERVLWNFLIEMLPGAYALDYKTTHSNYQSFPQNACKFIREYQPFTRVIIQNGTFIKKVSDRIFTISLVQDDLRSMNRISIEQEATLKSSQVVVANSVATAISYSDFAPQIIPLGLDDKLFRPMNKSFLRAKYGYKKEERIGIFVGSFSEVKGWNEVSSCIKKHKDIKWILVTKKIESFKAKNVEVFTRVDQHKLAELLNVADFFILGSPVETQCLAALEACLCDIPILMHKVGIFQEFTDNELKAIGVFVESLENGIKQILTNKFSPREVIMQKDLTISSTVKKWHKLIEKAVLEVNVRRLKDDKSDQKVRKPFSLYAELYFRKKILKKVIGREYIGVNIFFSRANVINIAVKILKVTRLLSVIKKIVRAK